jgi:hypothetical protein
MLQITNKSESAQVIFDVKIDGTEHKNLMLAKDDTMRFTLDAGTVRVSLRPQGQAHYGLALPREIKSKEIAYLNYYDNLAGSGVTAATVRYLGDDTLDTVSAGLPGILTINTGRTGKIIKSVESPQLNGGVPVLIGRNGDETVYLNFNANGDLRYRDADAAGYTPIGSYAEFQLLNTYGHAPVNKYKQEADLNLLGSLDGGASWTGQKWEPIREWTQEIRDRFYPAVTFSGEYDGAGYAIRGLWVDNPSSGGYRGLFGTVVSSTLANIRIESGLVKGNFYTGGVVAAVSSDTNITNCYNNATVVGGGSQTGGVAGRVYYADMTGCSNSGAVSGNNHVGGVVGDFEGGGMSECYNSGIVTGGYDVGGVVGRYNGSSIIAASSNTGAVTGTSNNVGGVVGNSNTSIYSCYNRGAVNGNSKVGGVVGYVDNDSIYGGYNTGVVNGSSKVGGLAGDGNVTIANSYWLFYAGAASTGIGTGSDDGCTKFGEGSWPIDDHPFGFGVWSLYNEIHGTGYWQTLGAWNGGGTPAGAASTFPKLHWED